MILGFKDFRKNFTSKYVEKHYNLVLCNKLRLMITKKKVWIKYCKILNKNTIF